MRVGVLAKKIGMSRFYDSSGLNHAVTILEVNNCKVVEVKTIEKNGYKSVRISFGLTKKTNKPFKGFLKKNNLGSFKFSKEFLTAESDQYKVGNSISVNNFIEGQFVDVSSNSIGKGFAGGMKRHNFAGNRATHGVSISHRSHGSTGQCQDPGKVFKGKKMAGRLGNKKVTVQNLKVLKIDSDNNILLVKGAVPGHKGSIISIFDSVKKNQEIKLKSSDEADALDKQEISKDNPVEDNQGPAKISDEKVEKQVTLDKDSEVPEEGTNKVINDKNEEKKDSEVDVNNKNADWLWNKKLKVWKIKFWKRLVLTSLSLAWSRKILLFIGWFVINYQKNALETIKLKVSLKFLEQQKSPLNKKVQEVLDKVAGVRLRWEVEQLFLVLW